MLLQLRQKLFSVELLDPQLDGNVLCFLNSSARNFQKIVLGEKFLPRENFPLYGMCWSNNCASIQKYLF